MGEGGRPAPPEASVARLWAATRSCPPAVTSRCPRAAAERRSDRLQRSVDQADGRHDRHFDNALEAVKSRVRGRAVADAMGSVVGRSMIIAPRRASDAGCRCGRSRRSTGAVWPGVSVTSAATAKKAARCASTEIRRCAERTSRCAARCTRVRRDPWRGVPSLRLLGGDANDRGPGSAAGAVRRGQTEAVALAASEPVDRGGPSDADTVAHRSPRPSTVRGAL